MATFLTTPKMSAELAARVEASVRGRPVGRKLSPRAVSLLRAGAVAVVVAAGVWTALARNRYNAALEADRASLLAAARAESSQLAEAERTMVPRVSGWLRQQAGAYEGDFVAAELRGAAAFTKALSRTMVYVRGPLDRFTTGPDIAELAQASFRDPFVLCLLDPPAKRSEKSLLQRARAAFAGGENVRAAAHVERLHTAIAVAPFVQPAWEDRVLAAQTHGEIASLRAVLREAPLEAARRAMRAELLLVAMDEPKVDGPTELDGASKHHIRVTLMDLESGDILLRLRKLVDPAWMSPDTRFQHANGCNSCEAALDVRAEVTGSAAPAAAPSAGEPRGDPSGSVAAPDHSGRRQEP